MGEASYLRRACVGIALARVCGRMPPASTTPRSGAPRPGTSLLRGRFPHFFGSLALLLTGLWLWRSVAPGTTQPAVDYSEFYLWLEADQIASVTLKGQGLEGELKKSKSIGGDNRARFTTTVPLGEDGLLPLLRQRDVRVRAVPDEMSFGAGLLLSLLPWVLIIGAYVWLSRRMHKAFAEGGGPFGKILKSKSRKFDKETSVSVTFDDVAGLKSAKRDLHEVVQFLREPERVRRLGGKVPRGILLVGPPGTGKTLLARAVAGESGSPFYSISASEFIEMFVGVGAARVRDLFAEAKKNSPAIIFIDEIDAVGRARGAGLGGGHDEREQTLNQLLSEMDGFDQGDLAIVLAATNRPDVLDSALLRPGRFDRRVVVERPALSARRAILAVHTKGKPLAPNIDLDTVAGNTPGFSGADLANLVNEATLGATRREAETISNEDFNEAFDKILLGDPSEARLSPKEKRRVAIHEAGHAVATSFSEDAEPLHRVSILPRGMALGVTQQTSGGDRHVRAQPELEARLRVLMGGYAAERLVTGSVSTGAENDLKEATRLASSMVSHYGMGKALGPAHYEYQSEHSFLGQWVATDSGASEATLHAIEAEARQMLAAALAATTRLLAEHRLMLDQLVEALMEHETLEKSELAAILGSRAAASVPSDEAADWVGVR